MTSNRHAIVSGFLEVLLASSLAALFAGGVKAQTYVFGRADFSVGGPPQGLATADFNGDDKLDVATANTNGTVSILLGQTNGTLSTYRDFEVGALPTAIVTGDFNGDHKIDLAVTNAKSNSVSILLGNGDGTFQAHVDYAVGSYPVAMVTGDFNRDGKTDLAIANQSGDTVSILLGNGDGTFGAATSFALSTAPQGLAVGDFNGDGNADLAVTTPKTDTVYTFLGNGNGTFSAGFQFSSCSAPGQVAAGDFNRDGILDLAIVCQGDFYYAGFELWQGNGDGTFQYRNAEFSYNGSNSIAIGDFNGDGNPDVLIGNNFDKSSNMYQPDFPSALVFLGDGSGNFTRGAEFGTGLGLHAVTTGDFNGDGKLDAIAATGNCLFSGSCAPVVSVLLGDGAGNLGPTEQYLDQSAFGVDALTLGDFNLDGKLDMALSRPGKSEMLTFLGNGDGTFKTALSSKAEAEPFTSAAGDFNGDGQLDLAFVSGCCSSTSVYTMFGEGSGLFYAGKGWESGDIPSSIAVGDFNGDGKLDLAVVNSGTSGFNQYDNDVSVLLGNGNGTFQARVRYHTGMYPHSVIAADFNNDGVLDLVTANVYGTLSVLLGNGDGTFQSHVDYTLPYNGFYPALTAADFNGDGKMDLAVTGYLQYLILLGNGDGSFQAPVAYGLDGVYANSIVVADFNHDGIADLGIGSPLCSFQCKSGIAPLGIALGNRDGTFQAVRYWLTTTRAGAGVGAIAVGDFLNDGGTDMAWPDRGVHVVLNVPVASLYPGRHNFGNIVVGTSSAPWTFTLSNPGARPLTITSVVATGNFTAKNNCPASLDVGASCTVDVTFTPTSTGFTTGALTFTDGALTKVQSLLIEGTGVTSARSRRK